ncbi:aminotransferase class-V [Hokovirus HKV1]|uniref:NifS-like protein n=1 Tax=Hokovirus HKV1 TaxID=1977638 RepID=A0A1V0SF29_9VIRU|nr:aminotransferase class-V [Hokovirus HKV1]
MLKIREKLQNYNINYSNIIYDNPPYKSKFNNKIIFADYIATGRPSKIIDSKIMTQVLPYYSNTHSNAYCGIKMKNLVQETKDYIKNIMNAENKKVIFSGNGTTGAINHLIYCMNLHTYYKVNIILSIYEHNSNYLPWIELSKKHKNIDIIIIEHDKNYNIQSQTIENIIKNTNIYTTNIIAITACSNVIGTKINIPKIYNAIQKYNDVSNKYICYKKNILLVDYACLAPYELIDAQYVDALYLSPHKYIGGYSIPGLIVADHRLFNPNLPPFCPGGNCTKKVCKKEVIYDNEIEKKESGGTPNIIGIIKFKYVLQLQTFYKDFIAKKEEMITYYIFNKISEIQNQNKNLIVLLPEIKTNRLPILCISIKNIHYNLLVVLFNDLFGIQTRGGISCTALLAEIIKQQYDIVGWCRICFHWLMDIKEIDYILNAINYISNNIHMYINNYEYDETKNLFFIKKNIVY